MNKILEGRSDLTLKFVKLSHLSVPAGYILLFLVIFIPTYFYGKLPEKIPYHFDLAGQPDAYGSKVTILFLPVIAVILFVMMSLIPKLNFNYNYPVTINEDNREIQKLLSESLLKIMKSTLLIVFLLIEIQVIQSVYEYKIFLSQYGIILYLVIIFTPIIIYLIVSGREK